MSKPVIAAQLLAAQVAINVALMNVEIREAVARFGYDEERLLAGRALYEEAEEGVSGQRWVYGKQYGASQALRNARDEADEAYRLTLKVARIAFRDNTMAQGALLLRGPRRKSLAGWLEQATTFYSNLLATPDLLTTMQGFGFSRAKLEAEAALVAAVREAHAAYQRRRGEAQDATKQRNAKLKALEGWLADFKVIARAALTENPQMLEALGFGPV